MGVAEFSSAVATIAEGTVTVAGHTLDGATAPKMSGIRGNATWDAWQSVKGISNGMDGKGIAGAGLLIWDGTDWNFVSGVNNGQLVVTQKSSGGVENVVTALADQSVGASGIQHVASVPMLFSGVGTTYERQRNNNEGTLLSSAARTATTNTATQTNHNCKGITCCLDVTAKVAATTLELFLQKLDAITGTWKSIASSGAFAAAIGAQYIAVFGVGAIDADYESAHIAKSVYIPRSFRIQVVPSGVDSVTYSVDYALNL